MKREDGNNLIKNEEYYKMGLLYTQTMELYNRLNQPMELSPFEYYLINKKWLDNYKIKYKYNSVVQKLKNNPIFNQYSSAKKELLEHYIFENNKLSINEENMLDNSFCVETMPIGFKQMTVPKNIELVFKDCFEDCFDNAIQMEFKKTEVYIGNKDILIYDKEINGLYCCSLLPNDNENINFAVKVEYVLIFKTIDGLINQVGNMADLGGLNNYLTKNNLDRNKTGEQHLIDKGEKIGIFLKVEYKSLNPINNNSNKNNNDNFNEFSIFDAMNLVFLMLQIFLNLII